MKEQDGRARILAAAWSLLEETRNENEVTVRRVAERAGVGIGLINYHFKSKDLMLMEALGSAMSEHAEAFKAHATEPTIDPVADLKEMLVVLSEMGYEHIPLLNIASRLELTSGPVVTPQYIVPHIKRITGCSESEAEIRAFVLVTALQSAAARPEEFSRFAKIDFHDKAQREMLIFSLVDIVIGRKE